MRLPPSLRVLRLEGDYVDVADVSIHSYGARRRLLSPQSDRPFTINTCMWLESTMYHGLCRCSRASVYTPTLGQAS